jgi:hypothetical protein
MSYKLCYSGKAFQDLVGKRLKIMGKLPKYYLFVLLIVESSTVFIILVHTMCIRCSMNLCAVTQFSRDSPLILLWDCVQAVQKNAFYDAYLKFLGSQRDLSLFCAF